MKKNPKSAMSIFTRFFAWFVLILVLISCEKEKKDPTLETTSITAISAANYFASAKITEMGDYKILDHGFMFSIGTSPESGYISYNNKVSLGSTIEHDTFSSNINTGNMQYYLSNEMKVFVKAYITNERGTVYSKAIFADILKLEAYSVTPKTAKAGDMVTITGKGFSTPVSANAVKFNNVEATIVSVTSTQMQVIVPSGIQGYYSNAISIVVSSGGQSFQLDNGFSIAPIPVSFSPATGSWNTYVTVQGSGLYNAKLYFDDVEVSNYNSSSDYISATVPTSLLKKKFKIFVGAGGVKTEVPGGYFTMDRLDVNSLTELNYYPGSQIYFGATGVNPSLNYNSLFLGSTIISSNNAYSNLSFTIPVSIAEGNYPVKLTNGIDTVSLGQTISIKKPIITGISPTSGYPDDVLKISGHNLFATYQNSYVYFNGISQSPFSADSDQISLKIPWVAPGEYTLMVYVNWLGSISLNCPQKFTVLEPKVISITPSTGVAGTSVIIKGEGFGMTNGISVYFGNLYAQVLSSTGTQINVKVPADISKGEWIVKVLINYNQLSSKTTFVVP